MDEAFHSYDPEPCSKGYLDRAEVLGQTTEIRARFDVMSPNVPYFVPGKITLFDALLLCIDHLIIWYLEGHSHVARWQTAAIRLHQMQTQH